MASEFVATPEEIARVRAAVAEHGIERVLIGGADIHGQFRAKFIPAWRFENEPTAAMHIADVLAIMDIEDGMMPRPSGYEAGGRHGTRASTTSMPCRT